MKLILFGATGMVGQAVLREAMLDSEVERILVIGRNSTGQSHPKLKEILTPDLNDLSPIRESLKGFDACVCSLGISSMGASEEIYKKMTYDLGIAAAKAVIQDNPLMSFVYISAKSADGSEKGPVMWARIKGKAENEILAMPFKHKHVFRPAFIQPLNGERSKVAIYNTIYDAVKIISPLIVSLFKNNATTTVQLGKAILQVAKNGYSKPILEAADINLVKTVS